MRKLAALVVAVAAVLAPTSVAHADPAVPPFRHVFVIVLENNGYDETFGPSSPMPYLSKELTSRGELLTQYHATGHESLDNYISMISGQAPNADTQGDCQIYTDVTPGVMGPNGQAIGTGCVYPAAVPTVADQLAGAGQSWKGYFGDMAKDAAHPSCRHPDLNTQDTTQKASATDAYAARHNPFVYFHSIIDGPSCATNDVDLSILPLDLHQESTTPSFSLIVPNLCEDGHDTPCADGRPGGPAQADAFLQTWVPIITQSPAFQDDGLLVVTFDEAEGIPGEATAPDASSCCGELPGPNSPLPGIFGPGGGRTGAVLLSPLLQPGSTSDQPANHYSLLRTIEDVFGLDHLGYAAPDTVQDLAFVTPTAAQPAAPTTTATGASTPTKAAVSGASLPRTGDDVPVALVLILLVCGLAVGSLNRYARHASPVPLGVRTPATGVRRPEHARPGRHRPQDRGGPRAG